MALRASLRAHAPKLASAVQARPSFPLNGRGVLVGGYVFLATIRRTPCLTYQFPKAVSHHSPDDAARVNSVQFCPANSACFFNHTDVKLDLNRLVQFSGALILTKTGKSNALSHIHIAIRHPPITAACALLSTFPAPVRGM